MTEQQVVTVNIHSPRVQEIARHGSGILAVTLGNGKYQAHVNVFTSDAEWDELVSEVALWRLQERVAAIRAAGGTGGMPTGDRYCPECSFIGADKNDVTEHVFANHPGEVGK